MSDKVDGRADMVVWKHGLGPGFNRLHLRSDAEVLHVGWQQLGAFLWETHGMDSNVTRGREFWLVGTGQAYPWEYNWYVGTVLTKDGDYVFHVFEKDPPKSTRG
jgi:hypothetical protein